MSIIINGMVWVESNANLYDEVTKEIGWHWDPECEWLPKDLVIHEQTLRICIPPQLIEQLKHREDMTLQGTGESADVSVRLLSLIPHEEFQHRWIVTFGVEENTKD